MIWYFLFSTGYPGIQVHWTEVLSTRTHDSRLRSQELRLGTNLSSWTVMDLQFAYLPLYLFTLFFTLLPFSLVTFLPFWPVHHPCNASQSSAAHAHLNLWWGGTRLGGFPNRAHVTTAQTSIGAMTAMKRVSNGREWDWQSALSAD